MRRILPVIFSLFILLATVDSFATTQQKQAVEPYPVHLSIMAAETNKPLHNVLIEFREEKNPEKIIASVTSDPNGKAAVQLPKGNYIYLCKAAGYGISRQWLYLNGDDKEERKVWLNKAASFGGRLLDGKGKPLAGFRLAVDRLFSTETDSEGRFSFNELDSHGHDLTLEQSGWVFEKSIYPQVRAGEKRQLGDLTVRHAASLEINVKLTDSIRIASPSGISITVNGSSIWRSGKLNGKGNVKIGMLPPGTYKVSVSDERMEQTETQILLKEEENLQVSLKVTPRPPSVEIEEYGDLVLSNRTVSVRGYGLWINSAKATIYRIQPERLINNSVELSKPEEIPDNILKSVKSFNVIFKKPKNEHRTRTRFKLPPLPPGMYLLTLEAEGATARIAFLSSNLGVVAKSSADGTLLQAVHLHTGKPVQGVRFYGNAPDRPATTSVADGTASWDTAKYGSKIVARHGNSLAILSLAADEGDERKSGIKGYLYTERTAYRPGQTVYYKGILRKNAGDDYQLPPAGDVTIKVTDSGEKTVFEETVTSGTSGSFHGQFKIPETPALGEFSIVASKNEEQWRGSFKVLEYRKPEFEVKLNSTEKYWLGGSQIPLKLAARYYFGAPVANGKVTWRLYSQPWYQDDPAGGGFSEENYRFGGYSEFIGEGEAKLDPDGTASITVSAKTHEQPVIYSIEADVTDISGRMVSGSASLTVTPSLLDVRIKGDEYLLKPGIKTIFTARVADWNGKPEPEQPVIMEIEQQRYDSKSRTWSWKAVATVNGATGFDGAARLAYIFPDSGYWRIRAVTFDSRKRRSFDETYSWVWNEGSRWAGSYRELEAEFDRKSYKPGDTARLIVRSPGTGGSLLFTLEGRRIHKQQIIPVTSQVQVIEIPVTKELAPNIYVSLVTIHAGRFYHQEGLLKVEHNPGKLELEVKAERQIYAPGETARISIRSSSAQKPVPAEISLALVDEAIFAVAPETREEIYNFFRGRRDHLVRTLYSFPRLYLGGASKDAAAAALDEDLEGIKTRKQFKDTAGWFPILVTDIKGELTAEALLPDNLTTWRATAIGHTLQQDFGTGKTTFISRLPFMARLAPPRFLVAGDRIQIPALLTDASNKEQQVKGMVESTGLTLTGDTVFSGTVPAGGSLRREIDALAKQAGEATLRLSAAGTEGKDALELTIPILPNSLQREQNGAVEASSGKGETVQNLPADSLPGTAIINATFSPTVAGSIAPALERLIDFPYSCTEQTIARFVPAVYAGKMVKTGDAVSPATAAKLPVIIAEGLKHLADFQHEDGGWGWWKSSPSNPGMTALVMDGLAIAKKAGIQIDEQMINQGKKALERMLPAAEPLEAALLYRAFTAHGGRDTATEKRLVAAFDNLSPDGIIAVAESLQNLGKRENAAKMLEKMESLIKKDSTTAWIPDNSSKRGWGSSSIEITASFLSATSRIIPDYHLNPSLARYLARGQNGGWWQTTYGSANSVIALADYYANSREDESSYTARLLINDKEIQRYKVERGRLTSGTQKISANASAGKNSIVLEKLSGTGNPSVTTSLKYRVTPDKARQSSALGIERKVYRIKSAESGGEWRHEYEPLKRDETVKKGEDLEIRLLVKNSSDLEYIILEEQLPAGFEVRQADKDPRYSGEAFYRGWYDHKEQRDATMAWFIGSLPAGQHEFRFVIRPELKGKVTALPTSVWPMYQPELKSEGEIWKVEVR